MKHKELKRFYSTNPPTGAEIMDLVSSWSLDDWEVEIERKFVEAVGGVYVMPGNLYRYEITFSRMVS